jgi:hypothetical protein
VAVEGSPALARLQAELEGIYGVEAPARVTDFVISRERWAEVSVSGAPEELVVVQHGDDVEIGLYLDDAVIRSIEGGGLWTHERLAAHCQAVEGVSHFVYLTHRASIPRPVSHLELELQAEVDKFVTMMLRTWQGRRLEAARELVQRLFERVSYRENMGRDQRAMYEKANFLARAYCRFLTAKYVGKGSIDGLFADLRRMYRLGAGEKLSYAASGAVP